MIKIITWNVNGIRAVHKKGLFMPLIEKEKPDILCLQETKAMPHESPLDLREYEEFWNSAERKGYSGTAIFTKEKPISVSFGFSEEINKKFNFPDTFGDVSKEGRVMTAEFKKFFLVNVYTPNAKDGLGRLTLRHKKWDPAFLLHCKNLERVKPVIMCGDFNVAHTPDDLARPKENVGNKGFTNEERAGIDALVAEHFVDAFRIFTKGNGHYTWWSYFANARARNIGWRIDYFFASKKLIPHITKVEILKDVEGSDHCPVVMEIAI